VTARRSYPYTVLDVFTDRALAGNQLGVVRDADDLDDERMAEFARETRLSETTFVQSSSEGDYRNRIFTVTGEIPFAGHPSLGTAVAMALAEGKREATYVQETGAGLQPVDVRLENDHAWSSMLQEPAEFGPEVDVHEVVAAIGLVIGEAHRDLPPQVVSTGLPTLIAPVLKVTCVSSAKPDLELIGNLINAHGARTLYVVCLQEEGRARARMFTPLLLGGEDPATGSAAGPLCAYLHERGHGTRVEITQGVEIGRPSTLVAEMHNGRPRVGGSVVKVIEGEVLL
jgi:trans-2,3-dihydro-3-hydroxyanthranilate isomerase